MSELEIAREVPIGDNTYFYEEVEIEEDENDKFDYEEVPMDFLGESDEEDHDLRQAIKKLERSSEKINRPPPKTNGESLPDTSDDGHPKPPVQDFILNFLLRKGLNKTIQCFQSEYYELKQSGSTSEVSPEFESIPDVYVQFELLKEKYTIAKEDAKKMKEIAEKATSTWNKLRRERDFHRMHHRRVVQEKNILVTDMNRLKKNYSLLEPTIEALKKKYEGAMKEKMMMRLEKDKMTARVEILEKQLAGKASKSSTASSTSEGGEKARRSSLTTTASGKTSKSPKKTRRATGTKQGKPDSPMPPENRLNPYSKLSVEPLETTKLSLNKTFKGHLLAISGISYHPSKSIVATASDDRSWKLWSVPNGDLIMSGEGHTDWLSACDFHPSGSLLGTSSGDGTIKIWDFVQAKCKSTFSDHRQPVWDVAFHDCGDFIVSASIDHTAKVWDINSERCRQTLRGHVDSVNVVNFQPFSNAVCTASGDKTVSLWDIRTGLCVQTFYGHQNAVNQAVFNLQGDTIASCDASGDIHFWDIRMICEKDRIVMEEDQDKYSANDCCFDKSGKVLCVGYEDGSIKTYDCVSKEILHILHGHEDSVQCLAMDPDRTTLLSGGADNTFRIFE